MRVAGFLSKSLRITGWTLGGLLGLLVLAYVILLAINWRDQPPSAVAQRMNALLDDRPAVADADNSFVHLLGMSAPAGMDVLQAGGKRREWLLAVNNDPKQFDHPPHIEDEGLSDEDERLSQLFREHCRGDTRGCEKLLDTYAEGPRFSASEERTLSRYREMLKHRTWRETIPLDIRVPLPAFRIVLIGQDLHFRELRGRVRSGAAGDIRAGLEADLELWREVQKSSDILISKMIAVSAIRQHYLMGNMIIRELPRDEQLAAVPDAWRRETSSEELAMHQVMAGELRFSEGMMRSWEDNGQWELDSEMNPVRPGWFARVTTFLSRPLYQPQDQINHYAAQSLAFADRFQVPLQSYNAATEATRATSLTAHEWHLYNLQGWIVRNTLTDGDYADYPLRIASIEATRRAALLTVELRARGVAADQVPAALNEAQLRNPFNLQPFQWSEQERAVVHEGAGESSVRRHVYLY